MGLSIVLPAKATSNINQLLLVVIWKWKLTFRNYCYSYVHNTGGAKKLYLGPPSRLHNVYRIFPGGKVVGA